MALHESVILRTLGFCNKSCGINTLNILGKLFTPSSIIWYRTHRGEMKVYTTKQIMLPYACGHWSLLYLKLIYGRRPQNGDQNHHMGPCGSRKIYQWQYIVQTLLQPWPISPAAKLGCYPKAYTNGNSVMQQFVGSTTNNMVYTGPGTSWQNKSMSTDRLCSMCHCRPANRTMHCCYLHIMILGSSDNTNVAICCVSIVNCQLHDGSLVTTGQLAHWFVPGPHTIQSVSQSIT